MKKYFIDKLTDSKKLIDRASKKIIEAATEMELKQLIELPPKLLKYKEEHTKWINDLCKYCSVDDVIEVSLLKDRYSNEPLNLINTKDIAYYYRYTSYGVSTSDREKLIQRFGSELRETKLK